MNNINLEEIKIMKNCSVVFLFLCLLYVSNNVYGQKTDFIIDKKNINLFEHVAECPDVRQFQLNIANGITDLRIDICLSNRLISTLSYFFPFVSNLRFSETAEMNDEKIMLLCAQNFYFLKHLNLPSNKVGDKGAIAIANNFYELISLDLSRNQISDKGMSEIVNYLNDLIFLDVSCNNISDAGVKNIAENLPSLN